MEQVIVKNILDLIYEMLNIKHLNLTEEQIKKANQEIVPFIEELSIDDREFRIKQRHSSSLLNDKRIKDLAVLYYATAQDNVSLYNELVKEKYHFPVNNLYKNLFPLDKTLSSKFNSNEYVDYLLKYSKVFKSFYYSLPNDDMERRDKIIQDFADIIHKDSTLLSIDNDEDIDGNYSRILNARNIEFFGKDFLINTNYCQRKILNNLFIGFNDEQLKKVKDLLEKYPNISIDYSLDPQKLSFFTVDELAGISLKDMNLYERAFPKNLEDRIKEILELDPSFDCPVGFIRKEIFEVLDNSTIVGLTSKGMEEISEIEIPDIDNVVVYPVRKINRIVMNDNIRKMLKIKTSNHIKK